MTPRLSLCLPFYTNSGMLAAQYAVWASYEPALKAQIEIVLVDDGSPDAAIDVPRPVGLPALSIYRVLEDRPWHQHGARNLAASMAAAPWLFLTDMDHVLPQGSLAQLLAGDFLDRDVVYTFHRLDAPKLTPTLDHRGQLKPHVNTFALRKARYWAVGGYDEDAVGYGTDSYFRKRLFADRPAVHLDTVHVIRYPREVIPDASTRMEGMDPKAFRDAGRQTAVTRRRLQQKAFRGEPPTVLDFPWARVL